MQTAGHTHTRTLTHARAAVDLAFGASGERTVPIALWDHEASAPVSSAPRTRLRITSPAALRAMFLPPSELAIAEAFVHGEVEVDGDLESALGLAGSVRDRLSSPKNAVALLRHVLALPRGRRGSPAHGTPTSAPAGGAPWRRHTPDRDAQSVRAHYDVGNAFYALWLDRAMVYSCAYFEPGTDDLELAQQAKLELLCRKLRLRPGQQLLDVGCGWGALVRYAALHHGVRAQGITLSRQQAELANERIARAGLADRCTVCVADYRELAADRSLHRRYDRIVSVGMIEHVGRRQLRRYFTDMHALLAPGGVFLAHGIVAGLGYHPRSLRDRVVRRLWRTGTFIDRYVFPDGEFPLLGQIVAQGEAAGFETRDVESLREHYVQTLRHWRARLEAAEEVATALVGRERYRTWRLYLAASADAFVRGHLGLAQVVFTRPDDAGCTSVPATRGDLHARPLVGAVPWSAVYCE